MVVVFKEQLISRQNDFKLIFTIQWLLNQVSELESAYSLLNIEDDIDDEFFSEFNLDEVNLADSFE